MPGIIVGVDGSGHSQRALEWAMKEAAIRHAPLTVLTVHQAIMGFYGGVATYPDDAALTEKAGTAAQAEADQVLAGLTGPHRPARGPRLTGRIRSRAWRVPGSAADKAGQPVEGLLHALPDLRDGGVGGRAQPVVGHRDVQVHRGSRRLVDDLQPAAVAVVRPGAPVQAPVTRIGAQHAVQ